MSIKPLPPDVIAQVKSSSVITSLNGVVLGLIRNSLDANATKLNVSVDHRLGNCSVEDNGAGIPRAEFAEQGGLGKLHFTSKYPHDEAIYGRTGVFLYSVAALSLLSVTSHHRLQNSHNSLLVHNSEVVSRHIPALPEHRILAFPHGTRVSVRDLFGSMPVRVKHRALEAQRSGSCRDWDQLVRMVVSLLLGFPGEVSVTLRESRSARTLALRSDDRSLVSKTSRLLSRASLWDLSDAAMWVPLGASSSGISVDGCISLVPAPTRKLQFISLGIEPLPEEHKSNVLFDEVNKVFVNSQFGAVEDGEGESGGDRGSDDSDVSTSSERAKEYIGNELKVKKGIDRWPVFYLRISLGRTVSDHHAASAEEILHERHSSLSQILDLLRAMSYLFLKKHHFNPRQIKLVSKRKSRNGRYHASRSKASGADSDSPAPHTQDLNEIAKPSGIKVGLTVPSRPTQFRLSSTSPEYQTPNGDVRERLQDGRLPSLIGQPVTSSGILSPSGMKEVEIIPSTGISSEGAETPPESPRNSDTIPEGTFSWKDPVTKTRSLVDARTGFVVTPQGVSSSSGPHVTGWQQTVDSRPDRKEPSPWLKEILSRWKNPVFETTETSIPRLPNLESSFTGASAKQRHGDCCSLTLGHRDDKVSLILEGRVSKADLRRSEVISQVDQKFILVKVPVASNAYSAPPCAATIHASSSANISSGLALLLIDQHAADERCRVEDLMKNYFETIGDRKGDCIWRAHSEHLEPGILLGMSSHDYNLLDRFKFHFERWGIMYQESSAVGASAKTSATKSLDKAIKTSQTKFSERGILVTSLPPAIIERCRSEPNLLVELLRKEAWRLEGDQTLARSAATAQRCVPRESDAEGTDNSWFSRFHGCPEGILDLINSRACRSAIMFNDILTIEECRALLTRLGECAFPFQCAHGRPSMVPLLDLGPEPVGDTSMLESIDLSGPGVLSRFGTRNYGS